MAGQHSVKRSGDNRLAKWDHHEIIMSIFLDRYRDTFGLLVMLLFNENETEKIKFWNWWNG